MNQLSVAKKSQILELLIAGDSLRNVARIADVSVNTATRLLCQVGSSCEKFHKKNVSDISFQRIRVDEIWTFESKPKKKGIGEACSISTLTAVDPDSKLVILWSIGHHQDQKAGTLFIGELTKRISYNEIQISSSINPKEAGSHSSLIIDPDHRLSKEFDTSSFGRLPTTPNRKIQAYSYAIALHFVYLNFSKVDPKSLATAAMNVGLMKRPMTLEEITELYRYNELEY